MWRWINDAEYMKWKIYGNKLVKYHSKCVVYSLKTVTPEFVSLAYSGATARWPANKHDVQKRCRDFRCFKRSWWRRAQWALFQQQGVTAHTECGSMNWRRVMIGGRIASRFGDTAWPARSPYISECDYIFLGKLERQSIGQQTLYPRDISQHARDEFFFPVALRPNAGYGLVILEVSRSYTMTYHSR